MDRPETEKERQTALPVNNEKKETVTDNTAAILADANSELMAGTLEALRYLRQTIKDSSAPHTVRERCADSLLDRAGIVRQKATEKGGDTGKSLDNMDLRELEAFIKQTQKTITTDSKQKKKQKRINRTDTPKK